MLKRVQKIFVRTVLTIVGLLLLTLVLLNTPPVQHFLAQKVVQTLSKKLKTEVALKTVHVDLLYRLKLEGLLIKDLQKDTLLYAGEAGVRLTDWFFFHDKPVIKYLGLEKTRINLHCLGKTSEWNYDFISRAFASSDTSTKSSGGMEFDLQKVVLDDVGFFYGDSWYGMNFDVKVGHFVLDAKGIDYKRKIINMDDVDGKNTLISLLMYEQNKPKRDPNLPVEIDTTPFNSTGWQVKVSSLKLDNCGFNLTMNDKVPIPDLFDENHLIISKIKTQIKDISVVGDTITGDALSLYAHERCGITIKQMKAHVTVSPVASVCSNLYLELNHSKIGNYYAMHYKRFPNFLEYMDSVVMVGRLDNAYIDTRDIAFFAPEMKSIPGAVHITGHGKGTVANLEGHVSHCTDGFSTVKGDMTMKGLPDVYKTYTVFKNIDLVTNGNGIYEQFPSLRGNKDVTFEKLTNAHFQGSYEGHFDSFHVAGYLQSNLGNVKPDVTMWIPHFSTDKSRYSGKIVTEKADISAILPGTPLKNLTLDEQFTGSSFNADSASVTINGAVAELEVNGYNYRNISTDGKLSKKQFLGKVLVDDPNLALEFDGRIDFNNPKEVVLNSNAHLLYADLKALKLTNDSMTTSADFDLNFRGGNVDNFLGYARLYNIDLKRKGHRLNVDSVNFNVGFGTNGTKKMTVESNDIIAYINGNYAITSLPATFQYYLHNYIPNYINLPLHKPENQDIDFTVRTRNIDSLLAVVWDGISGFDNSVIKGSLNTDNQKLVFDLKVPQGSVGVFNMEDISMTALGNSDAIALSTNIEHFKIGDGLVNSSLSLTTTVANDSLNFTLGTVSPDTTNTLVLKGYVVAHADSLFLSVLPSDFYMNKVHWDIGGGSKVTYSKDYLFFEKINLSSGLQKISAGSTMVSNDAVLKVFTENLDLSQIGALAGFRDYQPDGRINGTVQMEQFFHNFKTTVNLRASHVTLGTDTVGDIKAIGSYTSGGKLLSFDPETGVYRDNSSINFAGLMSFDQATNQKMDGLVSFKNTPVSWADPFLTGILSKLQGTVNGQVAFRGTSNHPDITGLLALNKGGCKLDYMGTTYTVPFASIGLNNSKIYWKDVQVYDVFNNRGTINGYFSHENFRNWQMYISARSEKIEAMRLTPAENSIVYGNVIASMDSFTVTGPLNFIHLHAYNVAPAAKSHIYMPVLTGGDVNTYSYVSFKNYGRPQDKPKHISPFKLDLNIDANLNNLAQMTIVLDPLSGDAITARGDGNIQLSVPANNDVRINGIYTINDGNYTFSFKNLIYREFALNQGSIINFVGSFYQTVLDVNASYVKKIRLNELLNADELRSLDPTEVADAKTQQPVNVLMHMKGTLSNPILSFNMELPEKHSVGTYAYNKLMRIDGDEQRKLEQVGSLLLIGTLIPSDGLGGNSALSGTINNASQVISNLSSVGLTSLATKLTGDDKLNVDVKYNNYNYSDLSLGTGGAINRNLVKVGVSHPFLNDKLTVELGSSSDWGRSSSSTNNTFNITGDFKIQYALTDVGNLRLNAFRTSDYDVTLDKDITRGGVGISWRKAFDNFDELMRSKRYALKQKEQFLHRNTTSDTGKGH